MTLKLKQNRLLGLVNKANVAALLVAFNVCLYAPVQAQSAAPGQTTAPGQSGAPANTLPALGDGSDMSLGAERSMGDQIVRRLYRDPDFVDDAVVWDYVQDIWQPLLDAAQARGELPAEMREQYAWQILALRDRTVNAFALPGGYFGLHLGMLAVVSSRDELASVLGHELSHVTQRHISRLISKQAKQGPWVIGAMILGVLAAGKNADAGNAVIAGSQAVAAQSQLNFSRDMEREADRVGFGVMTQAGFAAQGFVGMFDKLQQAARLNDNGAYPYLRTHPLTTERMGDMQLRVSAYHAAPVLTASPWLQPMIGARASVLMDTGLDSLRTLTQEAGSARFGSLPVARQVGVLYATALASSKLRDNAQAQRALDGLMRLVHTDAQATRLARLLDAEISLAQGKPERAEQTLKLIASTPYATRAGVENLPKTKRPELFLTAELALAQPGAPALANAAQALQAWVARSPTDAQAWQLLSSVYAAQNQTLRAIRAGAEAQVAQLDYAAALDRLKAAQEFMRANAASASAADAIDAAIVDTRKRQVEALQKEQNKKPDAL